MERTDPIAVAARGEFDRFELGDLELSGGDTLDGACLAYVTHGALNEAGDNAVLAPSALAGTHHAWDWLIGPGRPLDTDRFFVICPNLFGMGVSTSPSNWKTGSWFPAVSIGDNVSAQHRLLGEVFGIERLRAVVGFSIGATQTFHWAAIFPDVVSAAYAFCGPATPSDHCRIFLSGIQSVIEADPDWAEGRYAANPELTMARVGRIWAGWGLSAAYYRERRYEELGFPDLESFLGGFWEPFFSVLDANDLLAVLSTWSGATLAGAAGNQEVDPLARIRARMIVAPADSDMYVQPTDVERETARIPSGEFRTLPGDYGHLSCVGIFPQPAAAIEEGIRDVLAG